MISSIQQQQYQIIIIKFSQTQMDFYSTLDGELAGCSMITFSSLKIQGNAVLPLKQACNSFVSF